MLLPMASFIRQAVLMMYAWQCYLAPLVWTLLRSSHLHQNRRCKGDLSKGDDKCDAQIYCIRTVLHRRRLGDACVLVTFLMKHAQGSVTIAVSTSSLWAMPVDRPMVSDESASITSCDAGVLGAVLS